MVGVRDSKAYPSEFIRPDRAWSRGGPGSFPLVSCWQELALLERGLEFALGVGLGEARVGRHDVLARRKAEVVLAVVNSSDDALTLRDVVDGRRDRVRIRAQVGSRAGRSESLACSAPSVSGLKILQVGLDVFVPTSHRRQRFCSEFLKGMFPLLIGSAADLIESVQVVMAVQTPSAQSAVARRLGVVRAATSRENPDDERRGEGRPRLAGTGRSMSRSLGGHASPETAAIANTSALSPRLSKDTMMCAPDRFPHAAPRSLSRLYASAFCLIASNSLSSMMAAVEQLLRPVDLRGRARWSLRRPRASRPFAAVAAAPRRCSSGRTCSTDRVVEDTEERHDDHEDDHSTFAPPPTSCDEDGH